MEAIGVDPRIVTFEDHSPTYHVYFWGPDLACDEYELTGATDVRDVLAWAEEHVPDGWRYGVHAIVHWRGDVGRLLLAGVDPA